MADHTVSALIGRLRANGKPDLSCAYGSHQWRYNEPSDGLKRCAGTCRGVYAMTDVEAAWVESFAGEAS